jgi:hypothetical protein
MITGLIASMSFVLGFMVAKMLQLRCKPLRVVTHVEIKDDGLLYDYEDIKVMIK